MIKYFLIISLFIFISCSQNNDKKNTANSSETENQTEKAAANESDSDVNSSLVDSNKTYDLKYKFLLGDRFKYRLVRNIENLRIMEMDTPRVLKDTSMVINNIDISLTAITENNTYEFEFTFLDFDVYLSRGSRSYHYTSNDDLKMQEMKMVAWHLALENKTFSVKISESGVLEGITKLDPIAVQFLLITEPKRNRNNDKLENLKYNLENKILKPIILEFFQELPGKEIKISDQWTSSTNLVLNNFDLKVLSTHKPEYIIKNNLPHFKIDLQSQSEVIKELPRKGEQPDSLTHLIKPSRNGVGSYTIDISNGLLVELESAYNEEYKSKAYIKEKSSYMTGTMNRRSNIQ